MRVGNNYSGARWAFSARRQTRPWLVTYRGPRGGTLKRRFRTEFDAVMFMDTTLSGVHPSHKTVERR